MKWNKILKILILISLIFILFYIKGCAFRDFTDKEIKQFKKQWEREEEKRHELPDWKT